MNKWWLRFAIFISAFGWQEANNETDLYWSVFCFIKGFNFWNRRRLFKGLCSHENAGFIYWTRFADEYYC